MTALLAAANLSKRFAGLVAVDQVSFTVAAGEIFAVIGPNSAGKTTLFATIAGTLAPDDGTATFAGNASVWVHPDKLFGRHLAVLGNTGSGKSCSVGALFVGLSKLPESA